MAFDFSVFSPFSLPASCSFSRKPEASKARPDPLHLPMKIKLYILMIIAFFCAMNKSNAESFRVLKIIDAASIGLKSGDFVFLGVVSSLDDPFLKQISLSDRKLLTESIKHDQLVIYTYGYEVTAVRNDINFPETSVFLDGTWQMRNPFSPLLIHFYSIQRPDRGQLVYYVRGEPVFDVKNKPHEPKNEREGLAGSGR